MRDTELLCLAVSGHGLLMCSRAKKLFCYCCIQCSPHQRSEVPECREDPGNEVACVGGKLHTTSATAVNKTYPPLAYIWKLLLRQRKNKPCARQAEREFVHVVFRQTLNKSMKYSIIIINHNYKPV